MSRVRSKRSIFQGHIQRHPNALLKDGEAFPECAVETADGTEVPDVVWASEARLREYFDATSWHKASEICVEVLSQANTQEEMEFKRRLYFKRGARGLALP
jgi:Uma2 family endonuclease